MTGEAKREYMREWRRKNRDKVKAQRERRETRIAVAALESVERVTDDVCIVRATGGREFALIREAAQ